VTAPTGWERVTSRGQTVYWNKPLLDGRRLTAGRHPERWTWTVWAADHLPNRPHQEASGVEPTAAAARRAAELAASVDTPCALCPARATQVATDRTGVMRTPAPLCGRHAGRWKRRRDLAHRFTWTPLGAPALPHRRR
jgi:hypothetical protein